MAYTATVTKQAVSFSEGIYTITVLCVVNDGTQDVWESTASGKYNPNSADLDAPKNEILRTLQQAWAKWKAEQDMFNSPGLDAEVATIQNTVNAYLAA